MAIDGRTVCIAGVDAYDRTDAKRAALKVMRSGGASSSACAGKLGEDRPASESECLKTERQS